MGMLCVPSERCKAFRAYPTVNENEPPRPPRISRASMTNQPPPGADRYRRSVANPCACCCACACAVAVSSMTTEARAQRQLELGMDLRSYDVHGAPVPGKSGIPNE